MEPTARSIRDGIVAHVVSAVLVTACHAAAETRTLPVLEEIEVTGLTPLNPSANMGNSPFTVQQFGADALARELGYSVASLLEREAGGVTVNDAQNNPLQPDIRFRGFTASPLLGSSPGLAVYYNGIRVNEAFGGTVQWDLLPSGSLETVTLIRGSNPVYGQNALGGAIALTGKTGFSSPGRQFQAGGGSDGHRQWQLESGGHGEDWGYLVSAEGMAEDGWRDHSPTRARNAYAVLSRRGDRSELDAYLNFGDTDLHGNGAAPEALLSRDRRAVFTHPDVTRNRLSMGSLAYRLWLDDKTRLSATAFLRRQESDSFNGDGSNREACNSPDERWLCDDDDQDEPVLDQFGGRVSSQYNASNNRSSRDQQARGGAVQLYLERDWAGLRHYLTLGGDYLQSDTGFRSSVEFAELTGDRSTTRSGLFDPEGITRLTASSTMAGLYVTDTVAVNDRLDVTLSLRYNRVRLRSRDRSGERPDLDASHQYNRLNGGLGAIVSLTPGFSIYASANQASRAPTQVELACSHPEAPCTLPNTFLADPPLDDVVSHSLETGLQGEGDLIRQWRIAIFQTRNRDDIHFQTTGGVSSNQGFFTNVGSTRHRGVEASMALALNRWRLTANYGLLEATYGDAFTAFSPNHPRSGEGGLPVKAGARLPGIPRHTVKVLLDYEHSDTLESGLSMLASSGVYLRGDEPNLDSKTSGFAVFNAQMTYRFSNALTLRAELNNLLDRDYERFGLYGEADEVLDDPELASNRFYSPAPPRNIRISATYRW